MTSLIRKQLNDQLLRTRDNLKPESLIFDSLVQVTNLIDLFFYYMENEVDKTMHNISKRIETAERDVEKKKPKEAVKVLKKAVKKNEKLVKIDREVRDPMIKKCKKEMKKGKKK